VGEVGGEKQLIFGTIGMKGLTTGAAKNHLKLKWKISIIYGLSAHK
jgi:hypothetical protein